MKLLEICPRLVFLAMVWLVAIFASFTTQASTLSQADSNSDYFERQFNLSLANFYWGELHGHSSYSGDTAGFEIVYLQKTHSPEYALQYARDVEKFDFIALNDHAELSSQRDMPRDEIDAGLSVWQSMHRLNAKFNNEHPGEGKVFVVFSGYEYTNTHGIALMSSGGTLTGYGHKNVIFKNIDPEHLPLDRFSARIGTGIYAGTAYDLWTKMADFRPLCQDCEGTALTIVHTPASVGVIGTLDTLGGPDDHRTDWNAMDKDFVRNVEIYSKWGSSEGVRLQEQSCDTGALYYYNRGVGDPLSVRNILYERWVLAGDQRFILSFLGGTDDHCGKPGSYTHPCMMMRYPGAITGIVAPTLTRNALWTGLWQRHTMTSETSPTGRRTPVLFAVESMDRHLFMGEHGEHDGAVIVRASTLRDVIQMELIVDGCLHSIYEKNSLAVKIPLAAGRHYIYARAIWRDTQGRQFVAWTSPVYLGAPETY